MALQVTSSVPKVANAQEPKGSGQISLMLLLRRCGRDTEDRAGRHIHEDYLPLSLNGRRVSGVTLSPHGGSVPGTQPPPCRRLEDSKH